MSNALVTRGAKLGHVWAVQARTPDVLGRIEERRQEADGIQDLESAGLDRGGAGLAVRAHLPLDESRCHAVAGEFGGGEQSGRASTDDQDVVAHHSISLSLLLVSCP